MVKFFRNYMMMRRFRAGEIIPGAVLTKDFADSIGSDCYAKDAMDTVRYAQTVDGDPA